MKIEINPGKKLIIEINGEKWARYPIKTHFIETKDNLEEIIKKYVLVHRKEGDWIIIGQKIISILQQRIIYKKDLKVGFWAKFLSKFVTKTPYGFSVGNPLKMQIAINLAGLPRIIFSGIIAQIGKCFKKRGLFYKLAGNQISEIDGFYGKAFPQYSDMGILGPINCDKICEGLEKKFETLNAIVDINDLGGNVLGVSSGLMGKEKLILAILKDNPLGQSNEQTPFIIVRKVND